MKLKLEEISLFDDGSMTATVKLEPGAVRDPLNDPVTMKFALTDNTIGSEDLAEGGMGTVEMAKALVQRVMFIIKHRLPS